MHRTIEPFNNQRFNQQNGEIRRDQNFQTQIEQQRGEKYERIYKLRAIRARNLKTRGKNRMPTSEIEMEIEILDLSSPWIESSLEAKKEEGGRERKRRGAEGIRKVRKAEQGFDAVDHFTSGSSICVTCIYTSRLRDQTSSIRIVKWKDIFSFFEILSA